MADRLYIEKKYATLTREEMKSKHFLGYKENGENINIFMFMFALGVNEGYRTKTKGQKEGFVQKSAIKDFKYLSFIYSVALQELLKEGKEEEINNTNVVYEIAEEYANTGYIVLEKMIPNFSKYDEETFVYEMISKLNEKIKEF